MGNLCGKESKSDNFAGPGRALGSAPAPSNNATAPIPATKKSALQGNGRTLGGPEATGGDDPRSAAAKAAEARAANNQAKTTRNQKLTNRAALEEASYAERRHRDADDMASARAWN